MEKERQWYKEEKKEKIGRARGLFLNPMVLTSCVVTFPFVVVIFNHTQQAHQIFHLPSPNLTTF